MKVASRQESSLCYDATSPTFLRRIRDVLGGKSHNVVIVRAGDVAGNLNSDGYVHVRVNGKTKKGHVIIWEMFHGSVPSGYEVDHVDRNPSNNLLDNLRLVPHNVNTRNRKKSIRNTSGSTGICFRTNVRDYCVAYYSDLNGKQVCKSFRLSRYGIMEAYKLAVIWRKEKLLQINLLGAGYTEQHGK